MPAVLTLVADAVAELLTEASHEFGLEFVATRSYPPKDEPLAALNSLRVDVVPVNHDDSGIVDRGTGSTNYLCSVDIGIRKKFSRSERDSDTGQVEQAEMDRLIELVEQVHDYLTDVENRRLPRGTVGLDATWENTRIRAAYMPRHYREWQQFTGLIRVSYRARKHST